jgi:3-dehydro-L-gulonate 2-dehydrogenase
MLTVSFEQMKMELVRVLRKNGFTEQKADECAQMFAETSLDGVYSHGLNRFPRFIDFIKKGWINVDSEPELINQMGNIERYDGKLGPGNLNAKYCMERAIQLAKENGMGLTTIRNTNHWMRGGTYGWQAVNHDCIGICWTNTGASMPPWGSKTNKIGNNPFVVAVPRKGGSVVLDMSLSQYSFGQLFEAKRNSKSLPVDGGFDSEGKLTNDPDAILQSGRVIPIGYWKGSGLAILLDLIVSLLSGGLSTQKMDEEQPSQNAFGYACSQIFIAIDPFKVSGQLNDQLIEETLHYIKQAEPANEGGDVYYPGEGTLMKRKKNLNSGIPVDEEVWKEVQNM